MNDRDKYRIWDIENKQWAKDIVITQDGVMCLTDHMIVLYQDAYIISHCTGVRDKNGTLIYEGDIVYGRNEYELSDVVCRDGVWMMSQFLGHTPALWEIYPIEVIGNIYENADLLKESEAGGNE